MLQLLAGFVAPLAGVGQAHVWVDADIKRLLLVIESVVHPPQLAALGRDKQVQAAFVAQLVGLVLWLGFAYFDVAQHGGAPVLMVPGSTNTPNTIKSTNNNVGLFETTKNPQSQKQCGF